MNTEALQIIEAALFAAGEPLSVERLHAMFTSGEASSSVTRQEIRELLHELQQFYQSRAVELVEVASGYRFQAKEIYAPWIQILFARKPLRYSRALLETLALVIYRQPITRGEIEDIRGVAVSTQIMKTLLEREWIRMVGQRDVPGKPALFGTTKQFLDDFNLRSLAELPALQELSDLEAIATQLELDLPMNPNFNTENNMDCFASARNDTMGTEIEIELNAELNAETA